jgi:hypothetical protein
VENAIAPSFSRLFSFSFARDRPGSPPGGASPPALLLVLFSPFLTDPSTFYLTGSVHVEYRETIDFAADRRVCDPAQETTCRVQVETRTLTAGQVREKEGEEEEREREEEGEEKKKRRKGKSLVKKE